MLVTISHLVEFTQASHQLSSDFNSNKALLVGSCGSLDPFADILLGLRLINNVPQGSFDSR